MLMTRPSSLPAATMATAAKDPKVCMPTWRRFDQCAYQSPRYESQDVLAQICDLDLLELQAGTGFAWRERTLRRLVWRDPTGMLAFANPGLQPRRLERDYDVFIATFQTLKQLMFVNAVREWKERSRVSVCILDELFAGEVSQSRNFLKLLREFDHVFVEYAGSVDAISEVIGRPCHAVPPAVDTIRFSPWPSPPPRVVDVHSIGRRRPEIHQELLRLVDSRGIFYVCDVFAGGAEARVVDHRLHRDHVAGIAKRSMCFMVAPAKWDSPTETRGQVAIANRYFEGAAAGAVLLGQASDTDEFRRLFDWPEAVVETRVDGSDVAAVLMELKSDPGRVERISRRNATQTLLRHDWAHRWREVFARIGVPTGPAMRAREQRLQELAAMAHTSSAAALAGS